MLGQNSYCNESPSPEKSCCEGNRQSALIGTWIRLTDSALEKVQTLAAEEHNITCACQVSQADRDEWPVVAYYEECALSDELVEISGLRVLFQHDRRDELVGKTLDWAGGQGFRLIRQQAGSRRPFRLRQR